MANVNEALNAFRMASRELFNGYFRVKEDPFNNGGWNQLEHFCEVEDVLFQSLVGPSCKNELTAYGKPQPTLMVSLTHGEFAPIMINREIDSGYWDYPVREVTRDATMCFVRFFDWDQLAIRDNRYVEVVIKTWASMPELQGKRALIESQYVSYSDA